MKYPPKTPSPRLLKWSLTVVSIAVVCLVGVLSHPYWWPQASQVFASASQTASPTGATGNEDTGCASRVNKARDESNSLALSLQAGKNIGLSTADIELRTYDRIISVPAMVIGRPGRSHVEVSAPLGGRVTRIYRIEGETVEPGQPLFDLRLTHEELVQAQSEFLRSAEELDVVLREIKRLESVKIPGAIPGRRKLEREYEQQKIEATLNAQKQSLLLHGLTPEQVQSILLQRTLVHGVTVLTPEYPNRGHQAATTGPFTVRVLNVKPGQYVDAGASLALLMDYGELYIQGRAFEQDADELLRVKREGWKIAAVPEDDGDRPEIIKGLEIVYVDHEIEPESRALSFYVGLPNEIVRESNTDDGHRFLTWRYRPGQRMQLRVPVEQWPDRIVLPVDAVAKEGIDYYVFRQDGDRFHRVPVHVEYQDRLWIVIAKDGSLFPGDTVATHGAHQLQMALKNKAGEGVDPHAGHNH